MIRFPHDIPGWLTEEEGRALARLSTGKRVLEIGSYCGRSTVCIAQTAESVLSVDPHDGRGTPDPRETYGELLKNLALYGVDGKVNAHRGTLTGQTLSKFAVKFGLAFIDGAHDARAVRQNIAEAMQLLSPGGTLAFHDYAQSDPGVMVAVNELVEDGGEIIEQVGSIAVVRPPQKRTERPLIALAMPRRGLEASYLAMSAYRSPVSRETKLIEIELNPCSLLNHNFNQHWAEALNARDEHGATHFAMMHDDVCPDSGWLTVLLDELVAHDADVVSSVVRLKDWRGLTSTAVYDGQNPWERKRLTLSEVADLPETFGAADTGSPLLINTGLWVCDLRKPWCDDWCFRSLERIVTRHGRRVAQVVSEDWAFGHFLNQRGAKVLATRKVLPGHEGCSHFHSGAFGSWRTDREAEYRPEVSGIERCVEAVLHAREAVA
jgi:hypothetical protein